MTAEFTATLGRAASRPDMTEQGFGRGERTIALMGLALLAGVVAGIVLVFQFVGEERARDLRAWQSRLGIVAESRVAELDGWLARQREVARSLADNPTIELLLTEIASVGGEPAKLADGEAQMAYVANLLEATADRAGFKGPVLGPEVPANVSRVALAGLALFGADGRFLAGAPEALRIDLPSDPAAAVLEILSDPSSGPSIRLIEPIYPVQGGEDPGAEIGYLVAIRPLARDFYDLLEQPGSIGTGLESVLLRDDRHLVRYLSPLDGKDEARQTSLDKTTLDLAATFALEVIGGFALKRDYAGRDVLVTSRALTQADWVVMTKIEGAEALAESEARLSRLLIVLLLTVGLLAVVLIAVWRHGASRRAARAAGLYRRTAEQLEQQRNLLRLVTDTQPTGIFIADAGGHYRFANRVTAANAGLSQEDLIGKTLKAVLGPAEAEPYLASNQAALQSGQPARRQIRRAANGAGEQILHSEHIPMTAGTEGAHPASVLVVERDVTAEVRERERRINALDGLVKTLVRVVDQRDPYAAEHSTRVGKLSARLAREMGLPGSEVETARIAGTLMNLGKILVPSTVLASGEALSDEEQQIVRQSIQATAALLEPVEFDGPVVESLRQCQERIDGSGGPAGLAGEEILPAARVIAVANAFIGMISERAHRAGLSVEEACGQLLGAVDRAFDRRVVVALINSIENKGGRRDLGLAEDQPGANH